MKIDPPENTRLPCCPFCGGPSRATYYQAGMETDYRLMLYCVACGSRLVSTVRGLHQDKSPKEAVNAKWRELMERWSAD